MWTIAVDDHIAWMSVSQSVGLSHGFTVQKFLHGPMSCLGRRCLGTEAFRGT